MFCNTASDHDVRSIGGKHACTQVNYRKLHPLNVASADLTEKSDDLQLGAHNIGDS